MNRIPRVGPMTNTLVERASASRVVFATTDALVVSRGE